MSAITFFPDEDWNGAYGAVFFQAQVYGASGVITCRIHSEVLRDKFGAFASEKEELLKAFQVNRSRIEGAATRLIEKQRYETDNTILIRREDL